MTLLFLFSHPGGSPRPRKVQPSIPALACPTLSPRFQPPPSSRQTPDRPVHSGLWTRDEGRDPIEGVDPTRLGHPWTKKETRDPDEGKRRGWSLARVFILPAEGEHPGLALTSVGGPRGRNLQEQTPSPPPDAHPPPPTRASAGLRRRARRPAGPSRVRPNRPPNGPPPARPAIARPTRTARAPDLEPRPAPSVTLMTQALPLPSRRSGLRAALPAPLPPLAPRPPPSLPRLRSPSAADPGSAGSGPRRGALSGGCRREPSAEGCGLGAAAEGEGRGPRTEGGGGGGERGGGFSGARAQPADPDGPSRYSPSLSPPPWAPASGPREPHPRAPPRTSRSPPPPSCRARYEPAGREDSEGRAEGLRDRMADFWPPPLTHLHFGHWRVFLKTRRSELRSGESESRLLDSGPSSTRTRRGDSVE